MYRAHGGQKSRAFAAHAPPAPPRDFAAHAARALAASRPRSGTATARAAKATAVKKAKGSPAATRKAIAKARKTTVRKGVR